MTPRPAEPADFQDIARLTNSFIRDTAIHFGLNEQTPEELASIHAEHAGTHPWYVGTTDGRFAGYAKSAPWRSRAAYDKTVETTVYVEQHARRQGIARALYKALLRDLHQRGFHTAVAGITLPNPPSVAFHESLGFTPVATFREVGRKFDAWHDVGFWQLHLDNE